MKIRKFLAFMLAATTLFAFTSCGDDEEDGEEDGDVVINGHGYNIAFGALDINEDDGGYHFALGNDLNDDPVICFDIPSEDFLGKTQDLTATNYSTDTGWWTCIWWSNKRTYWSDEKEDEEKRFKSGSLLVEKTGNTASVTVDGSDVVAEVFRVIAKGKTNDGNTFSISFEGPFVNYYWIFGGDKKAPKKEGAPQIKGQNK